MQAYQLRIPSSQARRRSSHGIGVAGLMAACLAVPTLAAQSDATPRLQLAAQIGLETGLDDRAGAPVRHIGLFAPVGVEWSFAPASTLMLQVLDLGTPLHVRLEGDNLPAARAPFHVLQMVSPGLRYATKLSGPPVALSFGVGLPWRSQLIGGIPSRTLRVSGAIAFDLPLLRIR